MRYAFDSRAAAQRMLDLLQDPGRGGRRMSRNKQGQWTFDGPGMCQERKCRNTGPRCTEGYCQECCAAAHAEKHTPPPKAGEFSAVATLIYRREFKFPKEG